MERRTQHLPLKTPEVAQKTDIPLDKAKRLFFKSFRFSQGFPALQHTIFDYFHLIRPEWQMSDWIREQVDVEVREPIYRFLTAKTAIHPKEKDLISGLPLDLSKDLDKAYFDFNFNENIDRGLKGMQRTFNGLGFPVELWMLTLFVVQRDFKFLYSWNGRPRDLDGKSGTYSPSADPMLSHICYYGFEGNSTGEDEFDQMFKDLGKLYS